MNTKQALCGADIFDGEITHKQCALLLDGRVVNSICKTSDIPPDYSKLALDGGCLLPGYVDLQVNGGGGILFNDEPTVKGIETICAAHAAFGTTSALMTLITDTPEKTRLAIAAGIIAAAKQVPGFLGLHLEGPHLSVSKRGAHDPKLIREMEQEDLECLLDAKRRLKNLMVTLAVENVSIDQIKALSDAGVIVSIGHSDASYEQAQAAVTAGAECVTHLFNAMSGLSHREPGLVGATLLSGSLNAGLIADGLHVNAAAISIALAAKKGPGKIFLVSDSMPTVGTNSTSFELNGKIVSRKDGQLTYCDGTLAGADLTLDGATEFLANNTDVDCTEAHRMASLYPAQLLSKSNDIGRFCCHSAANIIHKSKTGNLVNVWMLGVKL